MRRNTSHGATTTPASSARSLIAPTNSYQSPGRSNGLPPSNQKGTRQTGRDMSCYQTRKHDQPGPTVLPNMQCSLPDR